MILLPSFSPLAVLAGLSWSHDDDGYNSMQPATAASNQNMLEKLEYCRKKCNEIIEWTCVGFSMRKYQKSSEQFLGTHLMFLVNCVHILT